VVLGAAAVVLLIVLGVSAVRLLTLDDRTLPAAAQSPSLTAAPSTSEVPSTVEPTPTPTATTTPTAEPTSEAPPPPPPAFTVSAEGELCAGPMNELRVTATATVPLEQARIYYEPLGVETRDRAMSVNGSNAQVEFSDWSFAPEVRWWVEASSTDGRTFTTPEVLTPFGPC
jgi:hypothetical protein